MFGFMRRFHATFPSIVRRRQGVSILDFGLAILACQSISCGVSSHVVGGGTGKNCQNATNKNSAILKREGGGAG
jgi:hypothetical protein